MEDLNTLREEMRNCRLCLDAGHAITPGAVFRGSRQASVMVIGQAPGVTEVEAKRPFNAGSGRRLFNWLGAAGWEEDEFRQCHYMTAVTKCFPGKNGSGRGDRVPSKAEQALCRPFLERELALVGPRLLIPVGGLAIRLFYAPKSKLSEIIGTAAYFPPTVRPGSTLLSLDSAERMAAFDPGKPLAGRWLVALPHPSGASLWPNKPQNSALIDQAIGILADIRRAWRL